ncbi:hypothetical protein JCM1840_006432 [Sporobolomyces johnsonii]
MDLSTPPIERIPPSLVSLPPELHLRLLRLLDPQSISRLARTCSILYHVARSELLWKEIVLDLVREHGVPDDSLEQGTPPDDDDAQQAQAVTLAALSLDGNRVTWWDQAKFLLPHSQHLGYFASSLPFNSRIIRVAIVVPPNLQTSASSSSSDVPTPSPPPAYAIHAAHLRPFNAFSPASPPPASSLPFGSTLDPSCTSCIISRLQNPDHPDAGLSIDLVNPRYDFSAGMLDITPKDGPLLCRANSSTREGVAAAALNVGPPSSNSSNSRLRLRLALEPVSPPVHGPVRSYLRSPHPDLSREALVALFSGRLPRRAWPTLELVGLEETGVEGLPEPDEDGPRRLRRGINGACRGLEEWLTERGVERELARIQEGAASAGEGDEDDQAFVTGFTLRARRTPRSSPATTPAATSEAGPSTAPPLAPERRRGVGRNGGMAVLWNGQEDDPDDAPGVTILRAGDEGEGGVILRLTDHSTRMPSPPAPGAAAPAAADDQPTPDPLADAVDAAGEFFIPIKAPARPIAWDDPSALDENGEVLASSLEGLWVGTYGSHGLEFVHLSTGFSYDLETIHSPSRASPSASPTDPPPAPPSTSGDAYHRILTATKVTGDTNVPSGQTSWIAFLSPLPASPALSHLLDGPVPSIRADTLERYHAADPSTAAYAARGDRPDWELGTARAVGQIALSGFLQPSWTGATVRFVRRETEVVRSRHYRDGFGGGGGGGGGEGEGDGRESKMVETVEEIQLRWAELNKVAVFRRVRI